MTASPQLYRLADNEPVPSKLEDTQEDFIDDLLNIPAISHDKWFIFGRDALENAFEDMDDQSFVLTKWLPRKSENTADGSQSSSSGGANESSNSGQGKRRVPYTTNIVGFVRNDSGSVQLSISSRFSERKGPDGNKQPVPFWEDRFIAYMMDHVLHFNVLNLDFASQPDRSWQYLLVLLFPAYLQQALGKGMMRQYVRREHNDSAVRGRIDIARHIRENMVHNGKIAYVTREFDEDNPVTELIRHAIEYIDRMPFSRRLLTKEPTRSLVRQIRQATPHYRQGDLGRVLAYNRRHRVNHPYYREYRTLQQLCLSILTHGGVRFTGEDGQRLNGFIIDIAWLWEEYLNTVLKSHRFKTIHPRNKEKDPEKAGWFHYFVEHSGKTGRIAPDFLLQKTDDSPVIVADAKYKREDNIKGRDYQQVVSYMMRFESKCGLYLHPLEFGNKDTFKPLHLRRGLDEKTNLSQPEGTLYPIGLSVSNDKGGDYAAFCDLMKVREKELVDKITKIIDKSVERH